jgi:hypothetical protein
MKQFDTTYIDAFDMVTQLDEGNILKMYILLITAGINFDGKAPFVEALLGLGDEEQN